MCFTDDRHPDHGISSAENEKKVSNPIKGSHQEEGMPQIKVLRLHVHNFQQWWVFNLQYLHILKWNMHQNTY